tara:strand:+ start:95 stop:5113 length:5019 start_codon:yes stop_codon:yes gene_type:complete
VSSELKEKLGKLRERLLDLSRRNPLIQFSHRPNSRNPNKQRFIRIVNEVPENLIEKLQKSRRYRLLPRPEKESYDFNLKYESSKTSALVKKDSKFIQVFEEEPKFSLSCNLIRSDYNTYLQDKGINVLYVAIGFLQYTSYRGPINKKSKTGEKETKTPNEIYAPLILYPVKLTREKTGSGFNYFLESEENEIVENQSLISKLNKEEGVNLPALKYRDDKPLIEEYFKKIYLAILEKNQQDPTYKWDLKRWATIGLFKFGKLAIWDDLNFEDWPKNPLLEKQLVKDFINGVPTSAVENIGDMNIEQDEFEKNQLVDQVPKLIADADSTQYKVILKALEGKSMAVEGPPGTGKSQTITNIIGGLIVKNKKVLFAADKLAALQVVKKRLTHKNLGDYILELHSPTKSKKAFHENLKDRITKQKQRFFKPAFEENLIQLKKFRKELNEHVNCINKNIKVNNEKKTIFELIWQDINNKLKISDTDNFEKIKNLEVDFSNNRFTSLKKENIELIKSNLDLLKETCGEVENLNIEEIFQLQALPETSDDLEKLINLASELTNLIKDLKNNLIKEDLTLKEISDIDQDNFNSNFEILNKLNSLNDLNKDFILDDDLSLISEILTLVAEREDKEKNLEDWAKPFLENQKKFNLLESCLEEIKIHKPKNDYLTIEELLKNLDNLKEISNHFIREIGRKDKRINLQISLNDLSKAISYKKKVDFKYKNNENDILDLLNHSSDSEELILVIRKIKDIQRNNSQSKKLIDSGLEIDKVVNYGASKFDESIEVIKNASILGCLLDKEVRLVKKTWKKIAKKDIKKPSLNKIARIYKVASEYCRNIEKEKLCEFSNLNLDFLRKLSFQINIDEELESLILEIKNKFKNINYLQIIFEILENKSSEKYLKVNIPLIESFEKSSLIDVQNNSKNSLSNIKTNLLLLGDSYKNSILKTSYSNISFILDDLYSLKQNLSQLGLVLNKSNLYLGNNLEYSLSSSNIKNVLKLIGNLDLVNYESIINEKIEKNSIIETFKLFTKIDKLKSLMQTIKVELKSNEINNYISRNLFKNYQLTDLSEIDKCLSLIIKSKDEVELVIKIKRYRSNISDLGLKKGIDQLITLSCESNIKPSNVFEYFYIKNQIKELNIEKKINKYDGQVLSACRENFIKFDQKFIQDSSAFIDDYLHKDPSRYLIDTNTLGGPKDLTEGKLINYEIDKTRKFLPYRKFFKQARNSLQRMKPCFMMSPSSAAQCLPKAIDIFDVLIIDEASQMNPEEAIGLIARCKQIIIVGDQKQLPPDNRWKSSLEDEDDDYTESVEMDINESILELATKVLNTKNCSLGWHYRSNHNSLIDFSNQFFYNNGLTVFPSSKIGSEINLVKVDNPHYSQSVNRPEVLKVIETLKEQIIADPSKTILVASMNRTQAEEIKIELDRVSANDDLISNYISSHKGNLEELMIKNLENVQGDERDVVIISTVYGPDENGRVMQRFGDVSKAQGDRRLNVLFTRAKDKIFLVTSLKSTDIRPSQSSITGTRYLKEYLSYAETGKIKDTTIRSSGKPENKFEEVIMNSLLKRGYEVDAQVGCLSYSIDLCIKDPRDNSRYLLAVECDGASYHSSYSARVSDRLRQQVLENLGWNVFRIWSTDWWRSPNQQLDLLDQKIKNLIKDNNQSESIKIKINSSEEQKNIFEN